MNEQPKADDGQGRVDAGRAAEFLEAAAQRPALRKLMAEIREGGRLNKSGRVFAEEWAAILMPGLNGAIFARWLALPGEADVWVENVGSRAGAALAYGLGLMRLHLIHPGAGSVRVQLKLAVSAFALVRGVEVEEVEAGLRDKATYEGMVREACALAHDEAREFVTEAACATLDPVKALALRSAVAKVDAENKEAKARERTTWGRS